MLTQISILYNHPKVLYSISMHTLSYHFMTHHITLHHMTAYRLNIDGIDTTLLKLCSVCDQNRIDALGDELLHLLRGSPNEERGVKEGV